MLLVFKLYSLFGNSPVCFDRLAPSSEILESLSSGLLILLKFSSSLRAACPLFANSLLSFGRFTPRSETLEFLSSGLLLQSLSKFSTVVSFERFAPSSETLVPFERFAPCFDTGRGCYINIVARWLVITTRDCDCLQQFLRPPSVRPKSSRFLTCHDVRDRLWKGPGHSNLSHRQKVPHP